MWLLAQACTCKYMHISTVSITIIVSTVHIQEWTCISQFSIGFFFQKPFRISGTAILQPHALLTTMSKNQKKC